MIPYGRQSINQSDIDAVIDVLKSDFLTQGPKVGLFEDAICREVGSGYAVAVNSATSALHIACLALGVSKSDIVWTSPISFVASANCALYCGAKIDFVDIELDTFNICPNALNEKLKYAAAKNELPKVLIVVAMCGQSANMREIRKLTSRYGIKVIEDASHCIGGVYKGEKIGSGSFADITIFSFHPVKIVTTGEGGVAVTNDLAVANRMRLLRSHGITRNTDEMSMEVPEPWYYEQIELGFNYRITELQAALGISQMLRLSEFLKRRREIVRRYLVGLDGTPLILPTETNGSASAWHLFVVRLRSDQKDTRDSLFKKLRADGIGVNVHYIPIYRQPYYQKFGAKIEYFPNAETYFKSAISLPLYPELSKTDQDYVIEKLQGYLS